MDKISKSKDLYEFFLNQIQQGVGDSQLLVLYMLAVQKFTDEDKYTLVINLSYVLKIKNPYEARNYFTSMKMKYYKFLLFWKEYISFEIGMKTKSISKILKTNLRYINLTDFVGKERIIKFLEEVEKSVEGDLTKFVRGNRERFIRVEEVDSEEEEKERKQEGRKQEERMQEERMQEERKHEESVNKMTKHKIELNKGDTLKTSSNLKSFRQVEVNPSSPHLHKSSNPKTINRNLLHENQDLKEFDFKVSLKENTRPSAGYSPYLKKKLITTFNTPISNTPTSHTPTSSFSWNTKPKFLCNLNLNGLERASPDRKLKFSSYQSPDKPKTDNDTLEIKNIVENARDSARYLRNSPTRIDLYCTISKKEYKKCGMIGKGGNSKVYLVERESKFYALKVVNVEMDIKLRENTLKEIRTLEDLRGVYGIIQLIDTQVDEDIIYILLEYGSTDLNKYIRRNELSLYGILFFWEQMLKILKGLHARRYIHADLKPANFVIVDGNLKLIDFNISSKIRGDTTRLDLDRPCGTLNYLAPEVLDSTKKERRRSSDVWSLGIILYEMVYKRVPVDFNSQGDWLSKIENIQIEEGEAKYKKILKTIRECLRKNPKERPTVEKLLNECSE